MLPCPSKCIYKWRPRKDWSKWTLVTATLLLALASFPSSSTSTNQQVDFLQANPASPTLADSPINQLQLQTNPPTLPQQQQQQQQYFLSRPASSIFSGYSTSSSQTLRKTAKYRQTDDHDINSSAEQPARPSSQMALSDMEARHLTKRQQVQATSTLSFPQPFDTSLGTEFHSDTCLPFMTAFLNSQAFQDCHPFSLLLTTSDAFFQAIRTMSPVPREQTPAPPSSSIPLSQVLDASCKADADQCEALFNQLAVDIKSSRIGCAKDLEKQNALPQQALDGFNNYRLMRNVACLQTQDPLPSQSDHLPANQTNASNHTIFEPNQTLTNNSTRNSTEPTTRYCFEKAVASPTPDDLYYYYMPLGTGLPSGAQSSCDQCSRSIMKLYSTYASNDSLPLRLTYPSARTMTNAQCGPGFAPAPVNAGNRLASHAVRRIPIPPFTSIVMTCISITSSLHLFHHPIFFS